MINKLAPIKVNEWKNTNHVWDDLCIKYWKANKTVIQSLITSQESSENYKTRKTRMASVSDNCVLCKEPVRERQQGVQCDGWLKWNNRTCDTFNQLQQQATTEGLKKFANYVADNWFTSHTFPPTTWSVYKETVRTNNDLEGWHNGLNRRAKGKSNLPLYVLIQLLHKEAALVSLQIRLVSERRLWRHQCTTYKNMQKRLFSLWQQYEEGEKNSKQLLEACSHLVNPF